MARSKAPIGAVNELVRVALPVLSGVVADSGEILEALTVLEMDEPGIQYNQEMSRSRAIEKIATGIRDDLRKLQQALIAEEKQERDRAAQRLRSGTP